MTTGLAFLISDIAAASGTKDRWINLKWGVLHHTSHLVFLYRMGQSANSVPVIGKILRFLIEYIIRIVFGSDLSCQARIGPGLVIVHGHDIVIGADVIIGANCKIFNGVTLGNKDTTRSSTGNQPTLGNNVVLSTGAKILGPLTLGSNVIVGANSVVIRSFANGSVVAGVPAKLIRNRHEA